MLIGEWGQEKLRCTHVAVFGLGGVGGAAAEALARAGVGALTVIDGDVVDITNLNRQVISLTSNIGQYKADVAAERLTDINPDLKITAVKAFYRAESRADFSFGGVDYIIDAIDTVTSKLLLAQQAYDSGVPMISSMGTGNKLDPSMLKIDFIEKTSICPLARVMRKELKIRNIKKLPVVYSTEEPVHTGARTPGSMSFVPPVAGYMAAGYVIRKILEHNATQAV